MTDVREATGPHTGELLDGRYRLLTRVGEGGTAAVYRAEDTVLHRTVAIKLLRGPIDEAMIARTVSETKVLASLNHHALVMLFDARISADQPSYLAMEYVEGMTLRDLIGSGPIDSTVVASVAVDIAEALLIAHGSGVVHRDIKPSNVLLWRSPLPGRPWRAKLADFGIAHLLDSERVTTPGLIVGTMAYIAPEQARGEQPAPAADIYAFGLMLLEALTGSRPFAEAEGIGTVVARMHRPPEIPTDLDPVWRGLLRGMTASNPDDRPTALEVAAVASRLASGATATMTHEDVSTAELALGELTGQSLSTGAISTGDIATVVVPFVPGPAEPDALPPTRAAPAVAGAASPTRRRAAAELNERRRRRRAIGALVIGGVAAVMIALAVVWSLSSNLSSPTPTKTAVEEIAPATKATPVPSAPTQTAPAGTGSTTTAPAVDTTTNTGNTGTTTNGNKNKGPGKNSGTPGKGKKGKG